MKFYITSDTHFGHGRIIEYANRPFKNCDEMNSRLISNWNQRVKSEDTIFINGDFCFRTDRLMSEQLGGLGKEKANFWINQLNGNKIFIRGNHDSNNSLKTIIDCIHITFGGHRLNLVHKPEHGNIDFEINLVGHIHQHWKMALFGNSLFINVGVDVWKYMPVSLDEIMSLYGKFKAGHLKIDRVYNSIDDYTTAIFKSKDKHDENT